jgi:hypothetical protein
MLMYLDNPKLSILDADIATNPWMYSRTPKSKKKIIKKNSP